MTAMVKGACCLSKLSELRPMQEPSQYFNNLTRKFLDHTLRAILDVLGYPMREYPQGNVPKDLLHPPQHPDAVRRSGKCTSSSLAAGIARHAVHFCRMEVSSAFLET